jgi:chemotaxis methyl-accepting protein methylase
VEENNFPFTEFTQQGIIKYINRIASLRGESVERVLKDRSIFQNSHFSLTQDRIFLFENKADMFMINDLFETQLKDKKEIKIWVLGNAGGYDAYSISLLYEAFDFNLKTLEIINSDDNLKGLIRGREAKLPKSALAYIPVTLWPVYFKQEKETFTLSKDVRDNVIFDFYKPNPRFQPSGVDLIYAPNYLARNKEQRNLLLRNFYRALNPGGILALGLFENIEGLVKNLKKYYIKNRLVFIKES